MKGKSTEPKRSDTPVKPGERIAKAIARAGLCSRRDAERWIADGRVSVNGRVIESPALNVGPADMVLVDGKPLPRAERTRLFIYNKPRGQVTTARDPQGRPTIFQSLPEDVPRLISIGRLDINTEGLLLLTNDGGLARTLELPSTGWLRRYRVRAHGEADETRLEELRSGATVDGISYGPADVEIERRQGSNVWLRVGLREGKNREVKKLLEHAGLVTNRLIRISYGPFQLGDMPVGSLNEVRGKVLREQLGAKLAKAAGVDLESPVRQKPWRPPAHRKPKRQQEGRSDADRRR